MTRGRLAALACAALLALHAALAWTAVGTKSPTFDEPKHTLAASIALAQRDFRIDYDNPPLWKYWAALPNAAAPAHLDTNDPRWRALTSNLLLQWPLTMQTLYRDSHNDPDRLIGRSRFMMLLLSVALGALIARWAFELGGAVASVAAAFLFALDPNFLAHGPLVKNDVAVAGLLLALAHTAWRSGPRIRWRSALAIGLLCGAGCTVKLSGVVLPCVAILLISSRARPLPAAATALAGAAVVTVGCIWAVYGFRFGVSPDPAVSIDVRRTAAADLLSPPVRAVVWALDHRLLPEPWLAGFLFAHTGTAQRPAYLLGGFSETPWTAYLPLVAWFKTPVATLAAFVAAAIAAAVWWRRVERGAFACLAIPPLAYALFALTTPAASGVRHLLPIYPFLFIGCGIAASRAWRARSCRWAIGGLAAALALETLTVFPDYIAFFNAAAGGERAGVRLLGDSNLDWGQDLPLLSAWQHEHPGVPLSLAYFGTADPAHYGIRYSNLPGGYALGPPPQPVGPGVVAISATNLQGGRFPNGGDPYVSFRSRSPIAVLGGSIYLYSVPAD